MTIYFPSKFSKADVLQWLDHHFTMAWPTIDSVRGWKNGALFFTLMCEVKV